MINFKNLDKEIDCIPKAKTEYSAGYDCVSRVTVTLPANSTAIIPLGFSYDWEDLDGLEKVVMQDIFIQLELRSSLRAKGLLAGTGILDADYTDEVKLIVHNLNSEPFVINKGDRVAQILIMEHQGHTLLGSKYRENKQRNGGLGSTNKD
jgi:dUTP pyrophosphatase